MPLSPLDPSSATTEVERALQTTLAIALRHRYAARPSVAALRLFPTLASGSTTLDDSIVELIPVTGGFVYRWSATSVAADDGATVVQPADRGAGPGRWLVTTSTSTAGYLKAVRIFEGEDTEQAIEARLIAVSPAVMIVLRAEEPNKQSQIPGAFYRVWMTAEIWCASRNLRRANEALTGPGVADEASIDPGVLKIVGDVRRVLAGSHLGVPEWIDYCYPGAHRPKIQSMSEGQFIHSLSVRIPVTLRFEDADGEDFVPSLLTLQHELVALDDATLIQINPGDPDQVVP